MRIPALLVLVMIAVVGAPPAVSAAGPNVLSDTQAAPTSGTVDTMFAFEVTYVGSSPALEVTARVAGRVLPMILVSGTSSHGRWSTTTSALPGGSWPTTFRAIAMDGSDATVPGPTLTIASISGDPTGPTSEDPGEPDPAPSAQTPDAAPNPSPAATTPATPDAPAGPASPDEPTATDPGAYRPMSSPTPDEAGPMDAPAGDELRDPDLPVASADPAASAGLHDGPVDATPPAAAPIGVLASSPVADPVHAEDSQSMSQIGIAIAIGGMAVLVLIAGLLVIVARRRRLQPEPVAPAYRARAMPPETTDVRVAAALHRRMLRRAKVRLEEDPIVASIDHEPKPAARERRRR
jgi:hypothetical protein